MYHALTVLYYIVQLTRKADTLDKFTRPQFSHDFGVKFENLSEFGCCLIILYVEFWLEFEF